MNGNIRRRLACTAWALFCVCLPFFAQAGETETAKPLRIIASLFPQYDFARRVAGDKAEVSLLLPPGAESHSFEPTPTDMKNIAGSDIFIYTGEYMEPWAGRLAGAAGNALLVDASEGIEPRANDRADDHGHGGDRHFHLFDPHVWLDPIHAMIMVDNIASALSGRDPANADFYRDNAEALKKDLADLDADFRRRVEKSPRRVLVFGDRFAFTYLFARYGLQEIGPYNSCAPGAEPGLKAVIAAIDYVRDHSIPCVYREAQSQGRIAQVIAEETGAEVLAVDSLHNPTAKQMRAGFTYLDGMRANLDAFARGLE